MSLIEIYIFLKTEKRKIDEDFEITALYISIGLNKKQRATERKL
jgi:hypothetical protein